jgi:recombination protein RecT
MTEKKQTNEERALLVVDQSLEAYRDEFTKLLGATVDPEVFMGVAYEAMRTNPDLLDVALQSPDSLMKALHDAAALKLIPNGILGSAYIVPRRNKNTGRKEAYFQPGYRGLVDLTLRSGKVSNVQSRIVYENESFRVLYGTSPSIEHEPILDGSERGKVRGAYGVGLLRDGSVVIDYMTVDQLNAIRDRSPAKSGPWSTDYEEMCRKTVVRRLCKSLPMSVEVQRAIELDDLAESTTEVIPAIVEKPRASSLAGRVRQLQDSGVSVTREDAKDVTPDELRASMSGQQVAFVEGKTDEPGEPPTAKERASAAMGVVAVEALAERQAADQATAAETAIAEPEQAAPAAPKPRAWKTPAKAAEAPEEPVTVPEAPIEQTADDVPDEEPTPEEPAKKGVTATTKPPRDTITWTGVAEPQPRGGTKLVTDAWKGKLVAPDDDPDGQIAKFLEGLDQSYEVAVAGLLELVPWEKDGKAMPPYRKIIAYAIEVGQPVA